MSLSGTFLASMVVSWQLEALTTLDEIVNGELHSICLTNSSIDTCGAGATDEITDSVGCKFFRRVFILHSMRIDKSFMNLIDEFEKMAQVNTL